MQYSLYLPVNLLIIFYLFYSCKDIWKMLKNIKESFGNEDNLEHLSSERVEQLASGLLHNSHWFSTSHFLDGIIFLSFNDSLVSATRVALTHHPSTFSATFFSFAYICNQTEHSRYSKLIYTIYFISLVSQNIYSQDRS